MPIPKVDEMIKQKDLTCLLMGCSFVQSLLRIIRQYLVQFKIHITSDPAILLVSMYY